MLAFTRVVTVAKELRDRMFSFDGVADNVEASIFTASVKGILLYHVHCAKRLVTYGDLATATSAMPNGGQLAQALQRIAEDDYQAHRPISTAIVVSNETRMPGEGFFRQCAGLGFTVGQTPEERLLFWRRELTKLGVTPIVHDISNRHLLDTFAAETGSDVLKDGEVGVLSGLWSEERRSKRHPAAKDDDVISRSTPDAVFPFMSADEQRAKIEANTKFVYVPAHHLKEGDVLINPAQASNGGDVKVAKVDIQDVFKNGRSIKTVTWTAEDGSQFVSDELIHYKVRRSKAASGLPNGAAPKAPRRRRRR
jgi:hypothetical protein